MSDALRKLGDEAAIRAVIDRYCHAVDRGSAEDVAALFHPDGALVATWEDDGLYKGRRAVYGWYDNYMKNFRSQLSHLRHKISNVLIDLEGDEAQVVSYLDADAIVTGEIEPHTCIGRYDDRFVRDGDAWYFKERAIVIYYASAGITDRL